jgi:osmotically-inducible protein OsmY
MFRALFRLLILLVVLVAVAGFFLGWWGAGLTVPGRDTVGTAGQTGAARAREVGQDLSQKTADAAKRAEEALSDGALTAKIKAKMALDDTVKALDVDVDTSGSTVTVSGAVDTSAQRDRVVQLARETAGVTQVVDRLTVRK